MIEYLWNQFKGFLGVIMPKIRLTTNLHGQDVNGSGVSVAEVSAEEAVTVTTPTTPSVIPPASTLSGFPKLGGINIGSPQNYDETDFQEELAKRDIVVLGMYKGWSKNGKTPAQALAEIKTLNPNIIIGNYTDMTKANITVDDNIKNKLDTESGPSGVGDWWAYNKDGEHTSWVGSSTFYDVNLTSFVTPDADGLIFPQWLAVEHFYSLIQGVGFDFWYCDNNFYVPRSIVDWNRDGVNEDDPTDAATRLYWRLGQRAYYDTIKYLTSLSIMVNADSDLSGEVYPTAAAPAFTEYKNVVHGATLENIMGLETSPEYWGNWLKAMGWYYKIFDNLLDPKAVIFQVYGSATDYQFFRYAFGSCLLNNGYFAYTDNASFQSYAPQPWFDEYDLVGTSTTKWLGDAIDDPPTAAWQNGVYRRRFENGMVLVNPKDNGAQTVTIESGYKKISGIQDPITNDGATTTSISLADRDGIILQVV